MRLFPASVAMLLLLAGCQTATKQEAKLDSASQLDKQILDATVSIQRAQQELSQAGMINNVPRKPILDLREGQPVDVTWQGDAEQLLQKISYDSFRQFQTVGVKMPLPVNLDVKQTYVEDIVSLIQTQVGYRAIVSLTPTSLTLQYNRPE